VPNTRSHKAEPPPAVNPPETVSDLHHWIKEQLPLTTTQHDSLLQAVDAVIARHEAMWQASKQEALQAMSTGFSDRMRRMREELAARETTVSSITKYFEQLVADLTDRAHRDPKTRLMNFRRFIERLEQFLEIEQRGHWCAVGLVDIRSFKSFNDTYGHALGDRIIERVARLLCEQIRAQDIVAQDGASDESHELHARFGGDEFCFLIPDLTAAHDGWIIAERFRTAVERYDWTREDDRLTPGCVSVDVGCRGPIAPCISPRWSGRSTSSRCGSASTTACWPNWPPKASRSQDRPSSPCSGPPSGRVRIGSSDRHGGCSSGVERRIVDPDVAGSRPVTHPNSLKFIQDTASDSPRRPAPGRPRWV
jgi:diguanylate cyclase (GGDEF)-like protein